jgi:hypothetical protein
MTSCQFCNAPLPSGDCCPACFKWLDMETGLPNPPRPEPEPEDEETEREPEMRQPCRDSCLPTFEQIQEWERLR